MCNRSEPASVIEVQAERASNQPIAAVLWVVVSRPFSTLWMALLLFKEIKTLTRIGNPRIQAENYGQINAHMRVPGRR